MDRDLIAHMAKLTKSEMRADAQKKADILVRLSLISDHRDDISDAIEEIKRLRRMVNNDCE